jgi:predicted GNAT family acetyltransferase
VGFDAPGTAVDVAGPAERDAASVLPAVADLAREVRAHLSGRAASAIAESTMDGVLSSGMSQRVGGVAEIVGVATLPSARRRGLGAAVTAALARHARDLGTGVVFLSAGSGDIARVYERVGFRRIGTACIAEPA